MWELAGAGSATDEAEPCLILIIIFVNSLMIKEQTIRLSVCISQVKEEKTCSSQKSGVTLKARYSNQKGYFLEP